MNIIGGGNRGVKSRRNGGSNASGGGGGWLASQSHQRQYEKSWRNISEKRNLCSESGISVVSINNGVMA